MDLCVYIYIYVHTAVVKSLSKDLYIGFMQMRHCYNHFKSHLSMTFSFFFQERLKRCVQMESSSSQKLDNSRMHRNNAANALSTSSSSSSSSSVSMTLDAGPEKQPLGSIGGCHQMPTMTLSGLTVEGSDDEELKAKEKFQNNLGNTELHKDYKKQVPWFFSQRSDFSSC